MPGARGRRVRCAASTWPASRLRVVGPAQPVRPLPVCRWTEIDLGWLVSSETLLPPQPDGTPQRRVPVLVMDEVSGWQMEQYFTFYPALAAFLDIPPGLVAGARRTVPPRPSASYALMPRQAV